MWPNDYLNALCKVEEQKQEVSQSATPSPLIRNTASCPTNRRLQLFLWVNKNEHGGNNGGINKNSQGGKKKTTHTQNQKPDKQQQQKKTKQRDHQTPHTLKPNNSMSDTVTV